MIASSTGRTVRIGIFSATYPGMKEVGGIAVYTHSLAAGLVDLGHEVHVLLHGSPEGAAPGGARLHHVARRYAPVVERWLRGARESVETSLAARRLCRRHRLEVFEFPNFEGMGAAFPYLGGSTPPMVVRMHTSTAECLAIEQRMIGVPERFEMWRERAQCRRADALYVSTAAHRRHMAGELGVAERDIAIVPLGLPDTAPPAARAPRPRGAPPTVLYVGRLEPRKGTIDLLRAVPQVLARVPDARFVLAGADRPLAPGGVRHADWLRANLPPAAQARIELRGFVDDAALAELFQRADAFVAPSLYESFGLIFVEAMRVAVPVVGTRAGGIPEVVEDGVTGLLVAPGAPDEIAAAVTRLLTDEPLRLRLAAAGRRRFATHFSSRAMAERTVARYEEVLARRQATPFTRR